MEIPHQQFRFDNFPTGPKAVIEELERERTVPLPAWRETLRNTRTEPIGLEAAGFSRLHRFLECLSRPSSMELRHNPDYADLDMAEHYTKLSAKLDPPAT